MKLDDNPSGTGVIPSNGVARKRRPPNAANTRAAIFRAAKKHFAAASYDEVRLDVIAGDAEANVAMISRYFGSKEGLFAEVVKELIDPQHLIRGKRSTFGARTSKYMFEQGSTDQTLESVFLIIRATMSATALAIVRDVNDKHFARPFAEWLGGEDAELRAHLIQSSLLGTIQARLVNKNLEPDNPATQIHFKWTAKWLQEVVDGTWNVNNMSFPQIRAADHNYYFDDADFEKVADIPSPLIYYNPTSAMPHSKKSGRGDSVATRAAIFESAIKHFTAGSYETIGLRAIADGANADVALISRYFGSKHGLFLAVVEAVMNPQNLLEGDRSTFGLRVANAIYSGQPIDKALMNIFLILRSAMSPTALPVVREYHSEYFAKPIAAWLGGTDAELRANFISFAICGSVQSRLLDKDADTFGELSRVSRRYLALWLQAIVDDSWRL